MQPCHKHICGLAVAYHDAPILCWPLIGERTMQHCVGHKIPRHCPYALALLSHLNAMQLSVVGPPDPPCTHPVGLAFLPLWPDWCCDPAQESAPDGGLHCLLCSRLPLRLHPPGCCCDHRCTCGNCLVISQYLIHAVFGFFRGALAAGGQVLYLSLCPLIAFRSDVAPGSRSRSSEF